MMKSLRIILLLMFVSFFAAVPYANSEEEAKAEEKIEKNSFVFSEEMDDVVIREFAGECEYGAGYTD